MLSSTPGVLVALLSLATSAFANRHDGYHLIDLGALYGGRGRALSTNDAFQVVGQTYNGAGTRGFIWTNGVMTDIGDFGSAWGLTPLGVNLTGDITGYGSGTATQGYDHPFLRSGTTVTDIDPPANAAHSQAAAINDAGQVVGYYTDTAHRGFFYSAGSYVTIPAIRAGGGWCDPHAVNNVGQVVGQSTSNTTYQHAFLWTQAGVQDLGSPANASNALGISNTGDVVGYFTLSTGRTHACVWSSSAITDLHPAWAQFSSSASGINPAGQIGGAIDNSGYLFDGGQWQSIASLLDESGAGYPIRIAYGITEKGYITAEANDATTHPYALIPYLRNPVLSDTVFRGQIVGGGLAEVQSVDGTYFTLQPGLVLNATEAPVTLIFGGTSSYENPPDLRVKLTAHANTPGLVESIDLWDYSNPGWIPIKSGPATTGDSLLVAIASNAGRFVEPATRSISARISWRQLGPVTQHPWQISIDQVIFNSSP